MSEQTAVTGPKRRVPRTRGATSGVLLIVLGAWGGLAPFIGPYFNFGFTPDDEWRWTAARGWLEVLPGGVAVLGGLLLVVSASRATTVIGSVLGIVGGAWFVIGMPLAGPLRLGSVGQPLGTDQTQQSMELLALFTGLGALIIIVAAAAFGRLSVVTVRDADAAARREQVAAEATAGEHAAVEEAAQRENAERESAERQAAELEAAHREQAERAQAERAQAERAQAERAQAERAQAERAQAERAQAERAQAERKQAERKQAERAQAEREQAERAQAEREQAERAQAERAQAEREQAERAQAEHRDSAASATAVGATAAGFGPAGNDREPSSRPEQGSAFAADEPSPVATSRSESDSGAANEAGTPAAPVFSGEQQAASADDAAQQPVWHSSTAAHLPREGGSAPAADDFPPPAAADRIPDQSLFAPPAEPGSPDRAPAEADTSEPAPTEDGSPASDSAGTASPDPASARSPRPATRYEPGQYDLARYRNRRYGDGPVDQDQVQRGPNE